MIGYLRDIRDGLGVAVFTVICILGAMAMKYTQGSKPTPSVATAKVS